jgi:hypothetical protein
MSGRNAARVMRTAGLLGVMAVFAGVRAQAPSPAASASPPPDVGQLQADSVLRGYGYPTVKGLRHFCSEDADDFEHGMAIHQDGLASADPPAQVIEAFHKLLGDAGLERRGPEQALWRFPAQHPRRVLHVMPVSAPEARALCPDRLPGGTRTVVSASSLSGG